MSFSEKAKLARILYESRRENVLIAWVANSIATIWFPLVSTHTIRVGPRRAFILFFHIGRRTLLVIFGARLARKVYLNALYGAWR